VEDPWLRADTLFNEAFSKQVVVEYLRQRYPEWQAQALMRGYSSACVDPVEFFEWHNAIEASTWTMNAGILAMHLKPRRGIYFPPADRYKNS
jgi:hypothetical protein